MFNLKKKVMKNNYTRALFAAVCLVFIGTLQSFATDYTISFTGNTAVGSVLVTNTVRNTKVTVPAGEDLILTLSFVGINKLDVAKDGLRIFSNASAGYSTVSFDAAQSGNAQITAFGLDGRKIAGISTNVQTGENSFRVSLPNGVYVVYVNGKGYAYSSKMVNYSGRKGKAEISFLGSTGQKTPSTLKSANAGVTMEYFEGDVLHYKGISGNNATIVADVPTASKAVTFTFVECKDGSGNYYPTVKIGNQTWMTENLRTAKFKSGANIPTATTDAAWAAASTLTTAAWCYLNYSDTNNLRIGKFYNWTAVNSSDLLAPAGWHVPSNAEWITLNTTVDPTNLGIAGFLLCDSDSTKYWNKIFMGFDDFGFSARVTGKAKAAGGFNDEAYTYFWSTTVDPLNPVRALSEYIKSPELSFVNSFSGNMLNGEIVRCVKD